MKPQNPRRSFVLTAAALGSALVLPGCGGGSDNNNAFPILPITPPPEQPKNIVQLAAATPQLSLLAEAVTAAGLVDTLSATGPFTVFAPTNDAFSALLAELGLSKDALFADKALLTAVLTYHVLGRRVLKADIPLGRAIVPVGGGFFKIEAVADAVRITDGRNRVTTILSTDTAASNGVVHIVDRVLLPANRDIVQTAQATPTLSILVEAVVAAGLVATLKGTGPFTVFAPTDDAFAALLTELNVTKAALLADTALLTKVLTYHVVPGRVLKAEIPLDTPITTVQGSSIRISAALQITDARSRVSGIAATDIFNTNGVVHVINRVLLPPA
ncbi:MAG: fasciclin domain-containing protein [Comamonadaceae bacterium]|nr:MAG: fasciclin domain-containing protein [Comamonadaceae bacterium]